MSRSRLVLGNKPDWVSHMAPKLGGQFQLADELLQENHAEWADIVIPLAFIDYDILRAQPLFQDKALLPPVEAVAICNDKQLFRDWFSSRFDQAYLPAQTGASLFSIAKPRQGAWGRGSFLIDNGDAVAKEAVRGDSTMCMEDYVPGCQEFAFHLLFDQGQFFYSARSTYTRDFAFYIQGKSNPALAIVEPHIAPPQIFLDLLAALNYSGAACIDYKLDETGQIRIFEVNPRMGASLVPLAESYAAAYTERLQAKRLSR